MKKAQVTIFLLIAIVLLAAFLLLFNLTQNIAETRSKKTADMVYTDLLQKTPLTRYIEKCLDQSTKKAVKTISLQGGFFFQDQPGSIIDWDIPSTTKDNQRIAYQIYPPNNYFTEASFLYPCYTSNANVPPIMMGDFCYEHYTHTLPYYTFGSTGDPTRSINPDLCSIYNYSRAGYDCFCEECTGFSIEQQLESFIAKEIENCINVSELTTYNISAGNATVDIIIGNEDMTTNLQFPLIISLQGYDAETKMQTFSTKLPIRLKSVYDVARKIINQEINYISFNLISDAYDLRTPYLTYSIEPAKDESAYIYTINDTYSKIDGNNYLFRFAIKNRQPALDYYNPDNCYIDGTYYNICVTEGEEIFLDPIAYDPDNQPMFYKYSGWKADYDTLFTTTADNPTPHQESFNITTNIWHSSTNYKDTNRKANYQAKHEDVGPHEITIKVVDFFGLKDEQTVSIMVDDRPKVYFFGSTPYSDIPHDKASIEDPFTLNASLTTDYFGSSNLLFRWELEKQNKEYDYNYENEIIEFPLLIGNINSPTQFTTQIGDHPVILKTKNQESTLGQYQKEIEVYNCIPHRNPSPSYPFHNYPNDLYPDLQTSDPLMANHTCCSDGTDGSTYGSVKTGEPCYELTDYGCLFNFNSSDPRHIDPAGIISAQNINPSTGLSSTDDMKELFKRQIKVKCANRGNMCNGPVEITVVSTGNYCPSNCVYSYVNQSDGCR